MEVNLLYIVTTLNELFFHGVVLPVNHFCEGQWLLIVCVELIAWAGVSWCIKAREKREDTTSTSAILCVSRFSCLCALYFSMYIVCGFKSLEAVV